MKKWNVYEGYQKVDNITTLLKKLDDYLFEGALLDVLNNRDSFGEHSTNLVYTESGPLRECITVYLLNDHQNTGVDNSKFKNTVDLLYFLRSLVNSERKITRVYVTILEPGKKIYSHSDTSNTYFESVDRYQFYFSGNTDMIQNIDNTLFPVEAGLFYHFDHRQIHFYENNSSEDLILMVFDLKK